MQWKNPKCICNNNDNIGDDDDQMHTGQSVCFDSIYLKSQYEQHVERWWRVEHAKNVCKIV